MQKRIPFIVAIIIGLALTVYGGQIFLRLKAGHNQAAGAEGQPIIQLEPSDTQPIPTEPAWTLTKQIAIRDISARNLGTVRTGSLLPTEPGSSQANVGHFFIAGIILEEQSKNFEERTRFLLLCTLES